jgi:hypothetical protein
MRTRLAVLLALFSFFATGFAGAEQLPRLRAAAVGVAALVARAAAASQPPVVEPVGTRIEAAVRIRRGRKIVTVPQVCRDGSGKYDLVVHFHGAPETIEPIFQRSAIDAVFVVVNLGVGSGPYEDAYRQDGSLARLLDEIDEVVAAACPHPNGSRGRLALSAWSAGYGAPYRVLANEKDRELVDAILLADGLHAGFLDKFRQKINEQQMAPFDAFAERALRGDALFGITHTAIVTPSYASTTETARYLVDKHGLEKQTAAEPGPRASMTLNSRADRGAFHVRGYAGGDTNAHCDHLYAIGDTLYPMLRERWTR